MLYFFVLNIYCLVFFSKKIIYRLHFNDRPVKALSIRTHKIAYMLHPWAIEKRKYIYLFDRKTVEELIHENIKPMPVIPN